jgi:hypothetical protein
LAASLEGAATLEPISKEEEEKQPCGEGGEYSSREHRETVVALEEPDSRLHDDGGRVLDEVVVPPRQVCREDGHHHAVHNELATPDDRVDRAGVEPLRDRGYSRARRKGFRDF